MTLAQMMSPGNRHLVETYLEAFNFTVIGTQSYNHYVDKVVGISRFMRSRGGMASDVNLWTTHRNEPFLARLEEIGCRPRVVTRTRGQNVWKPQSSGWRSTIALENSDFLRIEMSEEDAIAAKALVAGWSEKVADLAWKFANAKLAESEPAKLATVAMATAMEEEAWDW